MIINPDTDNTDFYDLIKQKAREINIKYQDQETVIAYCEQNHFIISQPNLSKLLNHPEAVSIKTILNFFNVFNIDIIQEFSNIRAKTTRVEPDLFSQCFRKSIAETNGVFYYNPSDKVFKNYLGTYHAYFFSTQSTDSRLLHGLLTFSDQKDYCRAYFELPTGDLDENNNPYYKRYNGYLIISSQSLCAYCLLIESEIGEMCFLTFKYESTNNKKMACRMASAITSSSGLNRRPTVHRMYIGREILNESQLDIVKGQLRLNRSEMIIPSEAYEGFLRNENIPEHFKTVLCEKAQKKEFYVIDETDFKAVKDTSEAFINALCTLRDISTAAKYNKVSRKTDEIIYDHYKNCRNQNTEQQD